MGPSVHKYICQAFFGHIIHNALIEDNIHLGIRQVIHHGAQSRALIGLLFIAEPVSVLVHKQQRVAHQFRQPACAVWHLLALGAVVLHAEPLGHMAAVLCRSRGPCHLKAVPCGGSHKSGSCLFPEVFFHHFFIASKTAGCQDY